ncbi:unnamed protein product [Microthlaspi erraticum]|uniref:RING-type E3 ubiquitin transferase n=1 Tax=Microthlaspi erraticum TaxID=1685480 RepID=A0A6D2LE75_9BRAS|nr:unnamed protein product [Microthlaspi erraticum]CAA7058396.1 unnamed protein product [Microthlaspi erraticum]
MAQVPIDPEGMCMRCKAAPPPEESLFCGTCTAPWHASCLSSPPETLASTLQWECPDCSGVIDPHGGVVAESSENSDLMAAIHAIGADPTLTEAEKAKKRQELIGGKIGVDEEEKNDVFAALGENLNCLFCMQLPERPVTGPCGHNFCLKCFGKWAVGQGKRTCPKCRTAFPAGMVTNPQINYALVSAIRLAKDPQRAAAVHHVIRNEDLPDRAFASERAVNAGYSNATGGRIFVTTPPDHFGPVTAEYDPERNQGVLVGESWGYRDGCRQWGIHYPHMAGIAGQSKYGSQSVALCGGYDDDEDHGEWFIYTGSGGRDLSGNRRTSDEQTSDQKFERSNEALRLSCQMGYPVRVIRSFKEPSSYAPETGYRYDGVYRVEKCWIKVGIQGVYKVCRYLFVRCDNEAAPWTSDEHGDRPRPLPNVPELEMATDLYERKETPSWDFDESDGRWKWMKPPPASKKARGEKAQSNTKRKRLVKELSCKICKQLMSLPVTTPCAHNFCKACLESRFAGQTAMIDRNKGGRTLRARKNIMKCPCCPNDISDFLQKDPQVNRDLMSVIETLKTEEEEAVPVSASDEEGGSSSVDGNSEIKDAEEVEETPVVTEDADEQPRKRIKLDTDTLVSSAIVVESGMEEKD